MNTAGTVLILGVFVIDHQYLRSVLKFFVNDQLDVLFYLYLLHLSTCFEHHSAHHQEVELGYYIIWYD